MKLADLYKPSRALPVLFLFAVLVHLPGIWSLPLIDRDEPRFAEASREMIERQDWVVPWFNDNYRFDKPVLIYWFQIACYRVFGENDFAARFPSVLFTGLTALAIFGFGRRLYDQRVAFWAAIFLTLCLQTLMHARAAVADMPMILSVTLAWWAGWEMVRHRIPRFSWMGLQESGGPRCGPGWWWLFYISLGLGFLAKGPVAWVPLLTLLVLLPLSRLPSKVPGLVHVKGVVCTVAGLALMLAIVGSWGIPALLRTQGEFLEVGIGTHVVERSYVAIDGHGAATLIGYLALFPLYFITVFASFFPWSIRLPWMVKTLWRRPERGWREVYLLTGILLVFLVFSFYRTKLPHYTLPSFPLLSILLAGIWFRHDRGVEWLKKWSLGMIGFALVLGLILAPLAGHLFVAPKLVERSRPYLVPEMEFASVEYNEPSLVWYFRAHVDGFHRNLRTDQVMEYMEREGPRFVVLPRSELAELPDPAEQGFEVVEAAGVNIAKGEWVDLVVLIKRE